MGQAGLYYYYQTFAKALALLGQPTLTDASGQAHDWRAELTAALAKRQNRDGSWVNPADRFLEGDPNLVTAYGLLALAYARPKAAEQSGKAQGWAAWGRSWPRSPAGCFGLGRGFSVPRPFALTPADTRLPSSARPSQKVETLGTRQPSDSCRNDAAASGRTSGDFLRLLREVRPWVSPEEASPARYQV